ncbi:MAG: tetratricopeptide repeat protein, partial [Candidatus Woesearchaeota archaeon]
MKKNSLLGYITGFGIGLASLIPGTVKDKASIDDVVANLQPQNSQEQVNETNYKPDSVIDYAKNVVEPQKAYVGGDSSYTAARQSFAYAETLSPSQEAKYDTAINLLRNDNPDRAIEKFQSLAEDVSHNPLIYHQMGRAYQKAGETSKAIETYKKALKIDNHFAEAHGSLGLLYETLGEESKSGHHLNRYLEISPDSPYR